MLIVARRIIILQWTLIISQEPLKFFNFRDQVGVLKKRLWLNLLNVKLCAPTVIEFVLGRKFNTVARMVHSLERNKSYDRLLVLRATHQDQAETDPYHSRQMLERVRASTLHGRDGREG